MWSIPDPIQKWINKKKQTQKHLGRYAESSVTNEKDGHGTQELDGENILAKDLSRAMKEHLGNSAEFLNKDINSS